MSNVIICDKEIILRTDNKEITTSDFEKIKSENSIAEYFEETTFNLKALILLSANNLCDEYKKMTLRNYFFTHSTEESFIAFRAKALFEWHQNTKFCSACGTKLFPHSTLTAFECPSCHKIFFPRIEPCVIALVSRGDKILLARHAKRNQNIYACIAGFIESGESAEEAVKREIKEEVGITVKNIQYRASQSWPFPDQLMLAYTAEYESGDIILQQDEIAEANWFDKNSLPKGPEPGSIGYRLIHGEF